MGAKTWIAVTCVALAGAALAATAFLGTHAASLVAAPPNAEMVPAGVVFYAEVNGLQPVWGSVANSGAWIDLQASSVVDDVLQSETGKAASDLLSRLEKKAGYAIDAKRAMHFVGRQVSVAVDAVPESGDPAWVALAKLDVDALVTEMLRGEGDWTKLQSELARRTGAMDFQVEESQHGGRTVTTAKRGDVVFHAALLGDTLAVSDSLALLGRTIDVHAADGAGSLGRTPRFKDEIARLPKGALAYDWTDLEALRASKPALLRVLSAHDPEGAAAGAAERVLEGSAAAPALARATELPGGDLYDVRWSYSRTAAELAGAGAPLALAPLFAGFPATMETRNLGAVADAWSASALRRRLTEGAFGRKIREWLDEPERLEKLAASTPLARMAGLAPDDEHDAASRLGFQPDAFTANMSVHMLGRIVTGCMTGDLALGCDAVDGEDLAVVAAIRSGTEGYLLFLAAEGAAAAQQGRLQRTSHAGHAVFTSKGRGARAKLTWAHVDDVIFFSNDETQLARVLDAVAKPGAAAETSGLPVGWCGRVRWSGQFLLDVVRERMGREQAQAFESSLPASGEMAVYVGEAFRTLEVRTNVELPADMPVADAAEEPRAWGWLPEKTIVASGASLDLRATVEMMRAQFPEPIRKEVDEGLRDAREAIGVDIVEELLPAMGPEIAFSVTRATAAPAASQSAGPRRAGGPRPDPIAVPGVLLSVEVRDESVVLRALDAAVGLAEKSFEGSPRGRRRNDVPRFVREMADGLTMIRLEIPDDGSPVRVEPTAALGRGKLLIGIDSSVVLAAIEAEQGRATPFGKSAFVGRVRAVLPVAGAAWSMADWGGMLDQVAEYVPQFAEAFPPDELPNGRKRPEFPENPNAAAFDRFQRDTAAYQAEARTTQGAEVRKWIDACRVIDFVAGGGRAEGRVERRHVVVRFAD